MGEVDAGRRETPWLTKSVRDGLYGSSSSKT